MAIGNGKEHVYAYIAVAALFLLAARLSLAIINKRKDPTSKIPGPWYTNWTDVVLRYHSLAGRRPRYVQELHDRYGPIIRIAPDYLVVADLEAVKRIHAVVKGFPKSKDYDRLNISNPTVFSATDPVYHRERRRLLAGPMAASSLKHMLPIVDSRVRQTISRMQEEMTNRGAIDVFKWWFFMTTDVIGELTFGDSFRMLDQGKKDQYIEDIERTGAAGAVLAAFPPLASLSRAGIPVPFVREAAKLQDRLNSYARNSIARYKRNLLAGDKKPTLFKHLYDKEGTGLLSDEAVGSEARLYIIAGSDTTSNTLTYLVWAVCRHAHIQKALVEELQRLPDDFQADDLSDLPMLNNVIDETLRLYPVVPTLLPRTVPPEGVTFCGYHIPGGVRVATQAWTLHQLPDVFADPARFEPSRWENPTQAMKDAFMPFGGGARICLGIHLARTELRLSVARFFRTFPNAHVSAREGMSDKDMEPEQYFLIKPSGGRCLIEGY